MSTIWRVANTAKLSTAVIAGDFSNDFSNDFNVFSEAQAGIGTIWRIAGQAILLPTPMPLSGSINANATLAGHIAVISVSNALVGQITGVGVLTGALTNVAGTAGQSIGLLLALTKP